MQSIMISIHPKWVEKIISGEKTIEVRKFIPKCELPFKVYVYKSLGTYKDLTLNTAIDKNRGKVVAEFIVRDYTKLTPNFPMSILESNSQKAIGDFIKYLESGKKFTYAYDISNLKVYDKPKGLGEFRGKCPKQAIKRSLENADCVCEYYCCINGCLNKITKAPQNFVYVEDSE